MLAVTVLHPAQGEEPGYLHVGREKKKLQASSASMAWPK